METFERYIELVENIFEHPMYMDIPTILAL